MQAYHRAGDGSARGAAVGRLRAGPGLGGLLGGARGPAAMKALVLARRAELRRGGGGRTGSSTAEDRRYRGVLGALHALGVRALCCRDGVTRRCGRAGTAAGGAGAQAGARGRLAPGPAAAQPARGRLAAPCCAGAARAAAAAARRPAAAAAAAAAAPAREAALRRAASSAIPRACRAGTSYWSRGKFVAAPAPCSGGGRHSEGGAGEAGCRASSARPLAEGTRRLEAAGSVRPGGRSAPAGRTTAGRRRTSRQIQRHS